MIIFPGWDLSSSFLLDQMRRKEKIFSLEYDNQYGELRGSCSNIDAQTMRIWSLNPEHDKPTLMEIKEFLRGNVIF